jgi:hypothetical protein
MKVFELIAILSIAPPDMEIVIPNNSGDAMHVLETLSMISGHLYKDIFWPDFYCRDSWTREIVISLNDWESLQRAPFGL